MKSKFRISLRALITFQLLIALVLGWCADHVYQARRYANLQRQAEILVSVRTIRDSVAAARGASDARAYERAVQPAINEMLSLTLRQVDARLLALVYVEALKVPDWEGAAGESDKADISLSAEASVALAAIGEDVIPLLIGLLHSEDPMVRRGAAEAMCTLVQPYNARVVPLPRSRISQSVKAAVRDALARETDEDAAGTLRAVLDALETGEK